MGELSIGTLTGSIELQNAFSPVLSRVTSELNDFAFRASGLWPKFAAGATTASESLLVIAGTASGAALAAGAAIGSISAAIIDLGMKGSEISGVQNAFDTLAEKAGLAGDVLKSSLVEGVRNTVDDFDLMKATMPLLSSGIKTSTDDFRVMAEMGRELGKAYGTDALDGLNKMTMAMTTGRTIALARLGIIADTKAAEEALAAQLGVNANELTRTQKLQADYNAIMEATRQHLDDVGISATSFKERFQQAYQTVDDFMDQLKVGIDQSPVLAKALDGVGRSIMLAFGGTQQSAIDTLIGLAERFTSWLVKIAITAVQTAREIHVVWSGIKFVILSVAEGFVKTYQTLAQVNARIAEIAAGMPLATEGMKKFAADARAAANAAGQMSANIAGQIEEARKGLLGKSDFDARASAMMDELKRTAQAVEESAKAQGKLRSSLAGVNEQSGQTRTGLAHLSNTVIELSNEGELSMPVMRRVADAVASTGVAAKDLSPALQNIVTMTNAHAEAAKATDPPLRRMTENQKELTENQKELTKAVQAYNDAVSGSGGYLDLLSKIGNEMYEGIAYDHARGIETDTLAKTYRTTTTVINQVIKAEENYKEQIADTTEAILNSRQIAATTTADIGKSLQGMQRFVLQSMGVIALDAKRVSAQGVLIGTAFSDAEDAINKAMTEAQRDLLPLTPALRDLANRLMAVGYSAEDAARIIRVSFDRVKSETVSLGTTIKSNLLDLLKAIPQLVVNSFTGGGGLSGALNGILSMAGAQVGKMLGSALGFLGEFAGPIGGAIGSLVGSLGKLIGKLFDHVPRDLQRLAEGYGVALSESILKGIREDMKQFNLTEQAATIFNAAELFPNVDASNFAGALRAVHDAFSMVQTRQLTTAQATQVLDDMWDKLAKTGTSTAGVLSAKLVDLIRLQEQYGTTSKAVTDYVAGQMTAAQTGLNAALGVTAQAHADNLSLTEQMAKETDHLSESYLQMQHQMEVNDKIQQITGIHGQEQATAIAYALEGIIAANVQAGMSWQQAIDGVAPSVEELGRQLQVAGYDGGAAFAMLQEQVALAKDEIAGPALTTMHGYVESLVALSNAGLMNQETFAGLAGQVGATEQALLAQGISGKAVEVAMQTDLQKLWELQQQYGFEVNQTTQAMIDQAVQDGLVGEKHQSVTDRMLAATNRMVDVLERIAKQLGTDVPNAAESGARIVQTALDKIEAPSVTVEVGWHIPAPPELTAPEVAQPAAMGGLVTAHGIVPAYYGRGTNIVAFEPRGTDTVPAMLTPGESVRTVAQTRRDLQEEATNDDVVDAVNGLRTDLALRLPRALARAVGTELTGLRVAS
jgi:hypothetical protein